MRTFIIIIKGECQVLHAELRVRVSSIEQAEKFGANLASRMDMLCEVDSVYETIGEMP